MFRYVLALLLVNTYHRTSVNTLPRNDNTFLSNSLTTLADRCGNSFLASQIKSKVDLCSVIVPPYKNKQFECLIFYDINSQLCNAVGASRLTVNEDFANKVNGAQNVNKLCDIAKDWNVINITQYPHYKSTVERVFKDPLKCVRVCAEDDLMSEDTNFFCKYYKWGMEVLNSPAVVTSTQVLDKKDVLPTSLHDTVKKLEAPIPASKISSNTQSNITPNVNEQIKEQEPSNDKTTFTKNNETVKSETVKSDVNMESSSNGQILGSTISEIPEEKDVKVQKTLELPVSLSSDVDSNNDEKVEEAPPKKEDIDKDQLFSNTKSEPKGSVIEIPKPKPQSSDPDDYQGNDLDSDEGKEGLIDTQGGDDSDDPMLSDLDIKGNTEQNKNSAKRIEAPMSSFNGEIPQKEFFPNTLQDGFSEEDDHFFPFFLTAVILVVLLYILYHNKSKVSKVFLGLIVEGRQSGRRRNSRGHAYRRLDTLEQAMSANAAAPPSKIIY